MPKQRVRKVFFVCSNLADKNLLKSFFSKRLVIEISSAVAIDRASIKEKKKINELCGCVFDTLYHVRNIGHRYSNVFGPRQNSKGKYAGVIPRCFGNMLAG